MNDTESSALTRAICDRNLPRPLRAGMLREINNAGKGLGLGNDPIGLNIYYGAEIPLAFQDSHLGRNLLWYTLYSDNDCNTNLTDALVGYGCDPDAETAWNLSWRDMRGEENK